MYHTLKPSKKTIMKPFDLMKVLNDKDVKLITRNGSRAWVGSFMNEAEISCQLIGWVEFKSGIYSVSWDRTGHHRYMQNIHHDLDLFIDDSKND